MNPLKKRRSFQKNKIKECFIKEESKYLSIQQLDMKIQNSVEYKEFSQYKVIFEQDLFLNFYNGQISLKTIL